MLIFRTKGIPHPQRRDCATVTNKDKLPHRITDECKPQSFEYTIKHRDLMECSICGASVDMLDMYWKGAEYCQHGTPMSFIPVCHRCTLRAVTISMLQSGDTGEGIHVMIGDENDLGSFIQAVESLRNQQQEENEKTRRTND